VQDGVWPNLRARGGLFDTWRLATLDRGESADALDLRRGVLHDELRLFVRAVTRARSVSSTAVNDDDTGPSPCSSSCPRRGGPRAAEHPLSLRGLVALHRRTLTDPHSPNRRENAAGQLALLAAAGVPGADPDEWYGLAAYSSSGPLYDLDAEAARVSPRSSRRSASVSSIGSSAISAVTAAASGRAWARSSTPPSSTPTGGRGRALGRGRGALG
jgi:hypothetical protein